MTAAVVEYARAQRDAIARTDPAVRRGDEAAVHDMRVAVRRLRSTLRTFRGAWDRDRGEAVRAELKWLADQLAPVRDGQVMARRLGRAVRAEPPELVVGPVAERVRDQLAGETANGLDRLREALRGERYRRLLKEIDSLVDTSPAGGTRRSWVRKRARKAVRRADRLLDEARQAERPEEPLHEARKAYKRARYAVEVFRASVGKPARRMARRLSAIQDVLGDHQDTVITRAVLRRFGARAQQAGDSAFTYGLLHAHQQAAGAAALAGLPAAARKARRAKTRRWLNS